MSRLLAAEVLKARTIRGPFLLLLALAVITGVGVTGVIGAGVLDPDRRADQLTQTASFGLVFATLLGILLVTNEFRHGTVVPTFLVEPRRERVVAAKGVVGTLAGLLAGLLALAVTAAIAVPWLSARGDALGLDGDAAWAVVRLLAAYALSATLGVGIGFAVRSQVGAVVGTLAWFLVGEPLASLLGLLVDRFEGPELVNRYLPGTAFEALVAGGGAELLPTGRALALVLAYVAALLAIGLAVTLRRDAV